MKKGEGWLVNEFGLTLKKQFQGYYYEFVEEKAPLFNAKSVQDVENYRSPEPHEGRFLGLRKRARDLLEQSLAVTADPFLGGVLELAVWLRGFNKFYYDIMANPELADALLSRSLEINNRFWEAYLMEVGDYCTIVLLADDYGHQNGLLLSPLTWRKLVKPRLRELISHTKKLAGKSKIQFHSCGSIEPIIGELAEVGVDILNPIQPRAKNMDSRHLVEKYDKIVCYHGGIDIQYVLPKGTEGEVKQEVQRRIRDLAPGGGYILAAAHNIQPDVPARNVETMFGAALKIGEYPIAL